MAAKLTLAGTYALRFAGFDAQIDHANYVSGVGTVTLVANSATTGTITGLQRVTNSPMSGQSMTYHNTTYALAGTYTIDDAGPPLLATAKILFSERVPNGARLSDQFAIVQSGPDRLWLTSMKPHDEVHDEDVRELVSGEMIKVDPNSW